MSLVINNNMMAMNAARSLGQHFGALENSTRRLSSGLRINQSSDDAAGLAVRELMRADITALQQGIRNANDAISLIQTADGALGVIDEKLIRMKELAMQASTGTYNSDQRLIIDSEYQAMASEITRIANSTDFNGIYLLNGNLSGTHNGSSQSASGQLKVHFGTGNDSAEDYYYIQINTATAAALGVGAGGGTTKAQYIADNNLTFFSSYTATSIFVTGVGYLGGAPQSVKDQFSTSATVEEYDVGNRKIFFIDDNNGDTHALEINSNTNAYVSDTNLASTGGGVSVGSTISTQALAQQALDVIQNAIISKDKIRANLGSLQNRLQNTAQVLGTQAENMQAAESRISDVDVAQEMTEFVKNQILTQAAVSMLAQANSLPRMALSLIG